MYYTLHKQTWDKTSTTLDTQGDNLLLHYETDRVMELDIILHLKTFDKEILLYSFNTIL